MLTVQGDLNSPLNSPLSARSDASEAAGEETAEGPGSPPQLSRLGPGASEVKQQIIRSSFVISEQPTNTMIQ